MYKDNYRKHQNDFDDKIQKELRKNNCVKLSKQAAKSLERNGLASWEQTKAKFNLCEPTFQKKSWWKRLWRKIFKK